jgi:hypothetical protein
MNFVHYDLGMLHGGETIEVTLGTAANVPLVDASNFELYRQGRQYQHYGGYVTRSPYAVRVPSPGQWHLAIDLGGYAGEVRSAVRVLPAPAI